jgi:hypothetical protein
VKEVSHKYKIDKITTFFIFRLLDSNIEIAEQVKAFYCFGDMTYENDREKKFTRCGDFSGMEKRTHNIVCSVWLPK